MQVIPFAEPPGAARLAQKLATRDTATGGGSFQAAYRVAEGPESPAEQPPATEGAKGDDPADPRDADGAAEGACAPPAALAPPAAREPHAAEETPLAASARAAAADPDRLAASFLPSNDRAAGADGSPDVPPAIGAAQADPADPDPAGVASDLEMPQPEEGAAASADGNVDRPHAAGADAGGQPDEGVKILAGQGGRPDGDTASQDLSGGAGKPAHAQVALRAQMPEAAPGPGEAGKFDTEARPSDTHVVAAATAAGVHGGGRAKQTAPDADVQAPDGAPRDDLGLAAQTPPGEDASPLSPRSEATARPMHHGIAAQIAAHVQHRPGHQIEITLDPEELGKISMRLEPGEKGLTLVINASRHDTLDYMRRHIDLLAQDLRDLGFSNLNFDFSGGDGASDRWSPMSDGATSGSGPERASPAPEPPATMAGRAGHLPLTGDRGLDLRI